MRTQSGLRPRIGMKSISVTAPSRVSKRVSRIERAGPIAARGLRDVALRRDAASGRCPCVPSSAAKQASESKRGQHSQSIEPSLADERGALAVADQGVVFNPQRHAY